jgi:hypothetical protein
MKGYIESYNNFGKFEHFRKPYDVDNQVTVRGNRDINAAVRDGMHTLYTSAEI